MKVLNSLIEEIAQTIFDNVPVENQNKVVVQTSILTTYIESTTTYYIDEIKGKSFDPDYPDAPEEKKIDALFIGLREEMYRLSLGKGVWCNVELVVSEDGEFKIEYDYDNKPNFEMQVDDAEYFLDNQEFPRDKESTPDWLNDILSKN